MRGQDNLFVVNPFNKHQSIKLNKVCLNATTNFNDVSFMLLLQILSVESILQFYDVF